MAQRAARDCGPLFLARPTSTAAQTSNAQAATVTETTAARLAIFNLLIVRDCHLGLVQLVPIVNNLEHVFRYFSTRWLTLQESGGKDIVCHKGPQLCAGPVAMEVGRGTRVLGVKRKVGSLEGANGNGSPREARASGGADNSRREKVFARSCVRVHVHVCFQFLPGGSLCLWPALAHADICASKFKLK